MQWLSSIYKKTSGLDNMKMGTLTLTQWLSSRDQGEGHPTTSDETTYISLLSLEHP